MNRRIEPLIATALTTAFFGGLAFGSPMLSLLVVGPLVAMLVYILRNGRRPRADPDRWAPSTPVRSIDPVTEKAPASNRQVSAAMAWVECRELAFSSWFGVGVGFLLIIFLAFGLLFEADNGETWSGIAALSPWFAHPLAGMTVIAVHRAATRPERDGTDELFEACPTEPATRTRALLQTAIVPLCAFGLFGVAYGVAVTRSTAVSGPITSNDLAIVVGGFVLLAGAVILGTALGTWIRFALAPVVAVIAIGFLSLALTTAGDPGWNGVSAISTFGPNIDSPLLAPLTAGWAYLLWVTALCAFVAALALLRHLRGAAIWVVTFFAAALATVGFVLAIAPVDDADAAATADLIREPGAHQECDASSAGALDVCTFPGFEELQRRVVDTLGPVRGALPVAVGPVTFRQAFDGTLDDLPPEVRGALPDGLPRPPEDEVWIGFDAGTESLLDYRLRLALWAIDPALLDSSRPGPTAIDGEARGVVALWLAARGLSSADTATLTSIDEHSSADDAVARGSAWPKGCGPVVWSAQDLNAARQVLALPEADVAAVVDTDFARWSDPNTGTDELLAALGLGSAGPYEAVVPSSDGEC